jgi:hypothetical protein
VVAISVEKKGNLFLKRWCCYRELDIDKYKTNGRESKKERGKSFFHIIKKNQIHTPLSNADMSISGL